MAYRFSVTDRSVQAGVRRIACEQIDKAIAEIENTELPLDETIFQVRKRCKKIRGLLRLVRPSFDGYARENAIFRDAARELSQLRDGNVLLPTLDRLTGQGVARNVGLRRALLDRQSTALPARDKQEALHAFRKRMVAARSRVRQWRVTPGGFRGIGDGLLATYQRAAAAFSQVSGNPADEALHEWRKLVKYHGCHVRLLQSVAPEVMRPRIDEIRRLGRALGEHHDLAVLVSELPAVDVAQSRIPKIVDLAHGQQELLVSDAFSIAACLFEERPQEFVATCQHAWQDRRHSSGSVVKSNG